MNTLISKPNSSPLITAALVVLSLGTITVSPVYATHPALMTQVSADLSELERDWQSDQMDIEYPFQVQPSDTIGSSKPVSADLSELERVWQSDQMDIEYPFQVQPGVDG